MDPRRVDLQLTVGRRELGRREVKAEAIRAGLEIDEGLEVRVADGPMGVGEGVLVVRNGESAVDGALQVCSLAVKQEDFLVDLSKQTQT